LGFVKGSEAVIDLLNPLGDPKAFSNKREQVYAYAKIKPENLIKKEFR